MNNPTRHIESLDRMKEGQVPHAGLDGERCQGCPLCGEEHDGGQHRAVKVSLARRLLDSLNGEDRALMHALFVLGKTRGEYAADLGLERKAVWRQYERIMKHLRKEVKRG